ncbi:hypothetical protein Glove_140g6 [Diversispora epigaea]|uniref:Uncharacterized protein n=1 Tax=Diversispora epigaea TaxID=1348612 RepID=A0A397J473_9GLOM|nr:hypothetical protein Glove_140g6 [Diversispora epigaea]
MYFPLYLTKKFIREFSVFGSAYGNIFSKKFNRKFSIFDDLNALKEDFDIVKEKKNFFGKGLLILKEELVMYFPLYLTKKFIREFSIFDSAYGNIFSKKFNREFSVFDDLNALKEDFDIVKEKKNFFGKGLLILKEGLVMYFPLYLTKKFIREFSVFGSAYGNIFSKKFNREFSVFDDLNALKEDFDIVKEKKNDLNALKEDFDIVKEKKNFFGKGLLILKEGLVMYFPLYLTKKFIREFSVFGSAYRNIFSKKFNREFSVFDNSNALKEDFDIVKEKKNFFGKGLLILKEELVMYFPLYLTKKFIREFSEFSVFGSAYGNIFSKEKNSILINRKKS